MENQILDTTTAVKNINGFMKKSTLNIIFVGRELSKLKDKIDSLSGADKKSAELEYALMLDNELPFGEKVADKFIRIARNKFICRYAHKMPSSYSVLYPLTAKGVTDEMWKLIVVGINPSMTTSEVEDLKKTADIMVNGKTKTETGGVDASPDTEVNADDFESKKEIGDTSIFDEDENSEQSPGIGDEGDEEVIPETNFESSSNDNVIKFTATINDDGEQFDDAVNIKNMVKIGISTNATDEQVEFLMGLINEFEDNVNDFLANNTVKGEENAA
jgi:hypothetical protein